LQVNFSQPFFLDLRAFIAYLSNLLRIILSGMQVLTVAMNTQLKHTLTSPILYLGVSNYPATGSGKDDVEE